MPLGWAAAAAAAGAIGGAVINSGAAKDASKTQSTAATEAANVQYQAAQLAAQLQLGMFNTIRTDLSPYRNFGMTALPGIAALMGLPGGGYAATQPQTAAPAAQASQLTADEKRVANGTGSRPYTPEELKSLNLVQAAGTLAAKDPQYAAYLQQVSGGAFNPTGAVPTGATPTGAAGAATTVPDWASYGKKNPDVVNAYKDYAASPEAMAAWKDAGYAPNLTLNDFLKTHYEKWGKADGRQGPDMVPAPAGTQNTTTAAGNTVSNGIIYNAAGQPIGYADNFGGFGVGQSPYMTNDQLNIPGLNATIGGAGTGAAAVPQARVGDPNWTAFLQTRPDITAEYQAESTRDAKSKANLESLGVRSPEDYARWWYQTYGEKSGVKLPTYTDADIAKLYPTTNASNGAPQFPTGTPTGPTLTPGGGGTGDIQAYLESLPGYQFTKDQGLKAVTNSAAAKGLGGMSGAYGKGIARFVTGLADQTYQQTLDNQFRVAGIGQAAANQTGAYGQTAASGAGSALTGGAGAIGSGIIGAANANAAGTVGSANALGAGLGAAGNALLTSQILGMYGKG